VEELMVGHQNGRTFWCGLRGCIQVGVSIRCRGFAIFCTLLPQRFLEHLQWEEMASALAVLCYQTAREWQWQWWR
jgi:hypothetical protein